MSVDFAGEISCRTWTVRQHSIAVEELLTRLLGMPPSMIALAFDGEPWVEDCDRPLMSDWPDWTVGPQSEFGCMLGGIRLSMGDTGAQADVSIGQGTVIASPVRRTDGDVLVAASAALVVLGAHKDDYDGFSLLRPTWVAEDLDATRLVTEFLELAEPQGRHATAQAAISAVIGKTAWESPRS